MMGVIEIARLAEDIRENGQAEPIVTYEGKILDGRNRYQACLVAGIEPEFTEYEGTTPLIFVVSHNLHRRHLNESQRGMVGARLANLEKGGDRRSDNFNSAIAPLKKQNESEEKYTQKQAAEMLNIGVDTIKRSKQVVKSGIPELQDMQMSGEISAKAASEVSKLPEEEQRKAVMGGVDGVKAAAKGDQPKAKHAPRERTESIPKWTPDDAERLWLLAKTDLDKILPTDKNREKVLLEIIAYAKDRIEKQQ